MKNRILAVLLAVVMMISVFSISVFADDASTNAPTSDVSSTEAVEDKSDDVAADDKSDDKSDDKAEAGDTAAEGESSTTTSTTEKSWFERHEDLVVTLGIVLAAAIIFFIVYFASPKFRAKVNKFWKDYNAEFKKLVWPTKQQLVRNSAVVFASIIAFGAVLALLDLGFSKGMHELKEIIKLIAPAK